MRTLAILFIAAFAIGCGDDDTGGSSSGSTEGTTTGQTQDLHCCLNGTYYQCATEAAFSDCISNPSGCTPVPSKDSTCGM